MYFSDNYSNISVAEPNRIIHDKLALGKGTAKPFGNVNRFDHSLFWALLIKQSTAFENVTECCILIFSLQTYLFFVNVAVDAHQTFIHLITFFWVRDL